MQDEERDARTATLHPTKPTTRREMEESSSRWSGERKLTGRSDARKGRGKRTKRVEGGVGPNTGAEVDSVGK